MVVGCWIILLFRRSKGDSWVEIREKASDSISSCVCGGGCVDGGAEQHNQQRNRREAELLYPNLSHSFSLMVK